jgi:hypothetical protein
MVLQMSGRSDWITTHLQAIFTHIVNPEVVFCQYLQKCKYFMSLNTLAY